MAGTKHEKLYPRMDELVALYGIDEGLRKLEGESGVKFLNLKLSYVHRYMTKTKLKAGSRIVVSAPKAVDLEVEQLLEALLSKVPVKDVLTVLLERQQAKVESLKKQLSEELEILRLYGQNTD